MVSQYISDLKREFKGYNLQRFLRDILAGFTVAAVALPLALAFGVGSGATAAAGLITAIISGFLISALSGASYQISGPTGAMTAVLIGLAQKYDFNGVLMVCLIAGMILVICALCRCGKLVTYIPTPVITGFTSGIAIIIALGQVDNFFGVKSVGSNAISRVISYFTHGFHPDWMTLAVGIMVVLIMAFWPKKLGARLPSSLAGIILAVIACTVFSIDVPMVGEIPKTLLPDNRLTFGGINWGQIHEYIVPAFSIAALGMIESLLCGASAGRMKGEKLNADRELLAQGIGNIIIPFFGGVPATAAIARTSVAIKSGCETRICGIVHAVGLLLSMFVLGSFMSRIPLSALAGVLMVTAWRMNEWDNIKYMFKHKFKSGIAMFLVTMISTVVFDLTIAILIGVLGSVVFFVIKIANIDVDLAEIDVGTLSENGVSLEAEHHKTKVVYITGPIFFATVEHLSGKLEALYNDEIIILSMRAVTIVDTSGAVALLELCERFQAEGKTILFSGVQPRVKKTLDNAGISVIIGEESFFWDATAALVRADSLLIESNI